MKYGFVFPKSDVKKGIEYAQVAEKSGWDGFFVWESLYGVDAWITLTAIACKTERIRIGTMITPLSRMRPWKVASELVTLDTISNGRVTLSVALGAIDTGFAEFGEEIERKIRAELLDEGLEIITNLWEGNFEYNGKHYQTRKSAFFERHPPPSLVQHPRIPIWVVAAWPWKKSMARSLKYDGILPVIMSKKGKFEEITPEYIQQISNFIEKERPTTNGFDIVIEGTTPSNDLSKAKDIVRPFEEAGGTWWIESMWEVDTLDPVMKRLEEGPPK
ncbi:LLM class flavin-dependent oxidoreductase [Candidatus Heimdallarchaeota archaeon B3_Heim]|nr:MAG: LLM class flavin-dependent oxidoreductase [Candidatus Heimdallarchaeota archaeon B3_Heim]